MYNIGCKICFCRANLLLFKLSDDFHKSSNTLWVYLILTLHLQHFAKWTDYKNEYVNLNEVYKISYNEITSDATFLE